MSSTLHAQVIGLNSGAQALVFLHGFMGRGEEWKPIAEALEVPWRRVLIDLPGHGASLGLPKQTYTFEGAVESVVTTLEGLGVTRPLFVGYSMGGRLALALALRYGEQCKGLWLESASPGIEDPGKRQQRVRLDTQRAEALVANIERFLEAWYRMPLFQTLHRRPELMARLYAQRKYQPSNELARALRGMSPAQQPNYWSELHRLTVPVGYACGEEDRAYMNVARRLKRVLPHATVYRFAGVGHNVHLEAPDAYIVQLSTFIRTCLP